MVSSTSLVLEELRLIKYSLLPDEILTLCDDQSAWADVINAESFDAVDEYNPGWTLMNGLPPVSFTLKLAQSKIWFQITLTPGRPDSECLFPDISVKGENITRQDHERWRSFIKLKLDELKESGTGYLTYNLISLHLLPELHAEAEDLDQPPKCTRNPDNPYTVSYHALLTSHHLISPTKRRNLQSWSTSLSLSGFAKVGYPGCIYVHGLKDAVQEFVANVKAMQWLALRVRFVEPLDLPTRASLPSEPGLELRGGSHWVEFEKVGEVVEEMKCLGREEFVVQMGIGSLGSSK